MEKIIVENITERQKLTIKNGINTYLYIMSHQDNDDEDFRDVYYDFYLKARSSVFAKRKTNKVTGKKEDNANWDLYFSLLNETSVNKGNANKKLLDVIENLHKNLSSKTYEFSFATKLIHTKCDEIPIYDSKVRKYLKEVYGKKFLSESGIKTISKIKEDWIMLNKWYKDFLATDEAKEWIDWFDNEFPKGKDMSEIKKIDTIIFACVN